MPVRHAALAAVLTLALGATAASAAPAPAKPKPAVNLTERVTGKATVKAIDYASRHLTLATESGDTVTMRVPEEVRKFDQLKVGDVIQATYARETEIAISQPGKPLPTDAQTVLGARSAAGEAPAALVGNHIVVTGAVLSVDKANNTLKLVSPAGGQVHTVAVRRPEGREALARLKPGDKITAYVTEALLISASPAK
jgi:hypothetical protein